MLAALVGVPQVAQAAAGSPSAAKGSYIVVLKDGADAERVMQRTRVSAAVEHRYSTVFNGFSAVVDDGARKRLAADPDVESVTVSKSVPSSRALLRRGPRPAEVGEIGEVVQPAQVIPTGVARVGGLASPTAAIDGVDQAVDVDIAVLDGGVAKAHPDLNVVGGVNCTSTKKSDWKDRDGHGTFVAGVAAARDNGIGTVGVAPGARLWAVRIVNSKGYADEAAEICGLEWVLKHKPGIEVVNISLSGGKAKGRCPKPQSNPVYRALCKVVANGTVVVVSAGNDAASASGLHYAAYSEVIAVSALVDTDGTPGGLGPEPFCEPGEADDTLASWSNYGRVVDVAAPGSCLLSTWFEGDYSYNSGTSLSAPLVAGAAGLLKADDPKMSPSRVRQAILSSATPGPVAGDPDTYPEPVLNVSGF